MQTYFYEDTHYANRPAGRQADEWGSRQLSKQTGGLVGGQALKAERPVGRLAGRLLQIPNYWDGSMF